MIDKKKNLDQYLRLLLLRQMKQRLTMVEAVAEAVASGALSAQLIPVPADVFLIAVPTPFRSGTDGIPQPNIDYVLAAARAIAPVVPPSSADVGTPPPPTSIDSELIPERSECSSKDQSALMKKSASW